MLKAGFRFIRGAYAGAFRLARNPRQALASLCVVSLYRNAGYLMAGTAVSSIGGFVFWIMAARVYSVEAVGLGAAAIAALGLLALVSESGLGIGLIRFLPGAGRDGNDMLNTFFTVSGSASVAIALVFLAGLGFWSPELMPVRQQPVFFAAFVVLAVANALQPLVSNVFLAKLNTRFIVIKNVIMGALKIAFLPLFAIFFDSGLGIFASQGLAVAIAVLLAALLFLPRVQDGYRPFFKVERRLLSKLGRYAAGNYVGRVLLQATPLILPLVVLNTLGVEMNAYFYVAWAIVTALKAIPSSVFNSLFAEGSNDEASIRTNSAKSLAFVFLLLLPLTLSILVIAEKLLLLFGQEYAENAALLLRVVVVAVIPWAINYLYISIERVRKNIKGVIGVTAVATCLSLGFSCLLVLNLGLVGVGIGYAAGQAVVAMAVVILLLRRYQPRVKM